MHQRQSCDSIFLFYMYFFIELPLYNKIMYIKDLYNATRLQQAQGPSWTAKKLYIGIIRNFIDKKFHLVDWSKLYS